MSSIFLSLILTVISRFKQSWLNCLRPFSDSSNRRPTIWDALPTLTNLDKCCNVFCDVWPKSNQPCFNVLCLLGMPPSKDEALTQGWFNVGPPSSTSAQHWTNLGLTSRVRYYWVCWVERVLVLFRPAAHWWLVAAVSRLSPYLWFLFRRDHQRACSSGDNHAAFTPTKYPSHMVK